MIYSKGHSFANKTEITFKEIDGLTMLLYSNIGFWYDLHLQTTPNARFLIQSERSAFNEIVKASTLPSFTSNPSIKREGQPENRNVVTITDESAHVTFYLVIKKQDKSKYDDLINTIENYYDY